MELNEPQQAYVMAEYGLQIMDPMLRDLVDPSVRDEDISPAYRCALAETACLCFCNAALCIEAEQGKKADHHEATLRKFHFLLFSCQSMLF